MKPTKTLRIKLLFAGVFFAITQLAFGQSITVKHYENGNLTTPSFFTNNAPRLCAVDSVQLEATGFSGTLSWSGPNGVISSTATTIWIKDQGWYYVSDGTNNASVNIGKDNSNPEIYSEDYPITVSTNDGVGSTSNASSPSGGLFGILSPNEEYLAPFGAEYAYNKQQYLYTSSELQNLGLGEGSTIKEMGFYLNDSWNSNCNTQVEIRVYQTTNSSLLAFETSSSNYLGSWGCMNYQSGWNYFDIGDFDWNGTDNLVFEFCYNSWGGNAPQNPSIAVDNVGFNSSVVIANPSNSQCSATGGFAVANYRPSTAFKYSSAALKDTIVLCGTSTTLRLTSNAANYTWSSANSTYSGSTNTLNVSSDDLVYITGYTNQFCKYDDTVQVYSAAESVPTITASSTDFCEGGSETLSTTLTSNQSARWSTGATGNQITISEGGTYTVTVSNEFGCFNTSSPKEINEVSKPEIFLSQNGFEVLNMESHVIEGNTFKKLVEGAQGELYFFSDQGIQISNLAQLLEGTDAVPTSIDNATEDALIHNAQNQYHNEKGGVYMLAISGRYQHSDASVIWDNGSSSTYTNWDINNLYSSGDNRYISKYYYSDKWEANGASYDQALIEYNANDLRLVSGSVYCDSVQLFAPSIFDTYFWSTGDTTESIWVSGNGSHTVSVTGTYTKSDGTTCSLTSDNYSFTINDAPSLSITNLSGTSDLTGSNHIEIEADYTSGASIQWSTGSTNDSIHVYSIGEYTATATLNGCSVSKSFTAYQPIYVDATNGDDANGTGTLSDPYKTIQKGINEVAQGGKVYVLPGTYEEQVLIYKGVYLASDFDRLGDSSAISSTIIKPGSSARIENSSNTSIYSYGGLSVVSASGNVTVSGFTIKDFQVFYDDWGRSGALSINENYGNRVEINNLVIDGTIQLSGGGCCPSAHVLSADNSSNVHFNNVTIQNSGTQNVSIPWLAYLNSVDLTAEKLVIKNTYSREDVFRLQNHSKITLVNSVFDDGKNSDWNQYPIRLEGGSDAVVINTTFKGINSNNDDAAFYISGSGSEVLVFNSIVDAGELVYHSGSGNSITVSNSVLPFGCDLVHSGLTLTLDSSNTKFGPANLTSNYGLASNSMAIGIGANQINFGGENYSAPSKDLYNDSRPNPVGSKIDAGAVESVLEIGIFDVAVAKCGYLISAQVFNSDNYTVEWIQNGTVLGTDDNYLASSKGTYTLKVYSVDRLDTITKTVALNNPLSMEILDVSNSCEFISSNNGSVSWGNISGGTPYSSDWWTYRTAVRNESGTQIDGYWHLNNPQDWVGTKSNLAPGKYYFFIDDATGCEVGDTVEILEQVQSTYYVSTTGDDSNGGLSEIDPFATISRAVSSTCKGDTVIVLDGTYFEDSITINGSVVIGSKYLIDGDTNHIHNTIIDGGSSAYVFDYPYSQTSSNWADTTYNRIEALTIQNGLVVNNDRGGALTLANERTLLINRVQFNSNSAQRGGAVLQREWSRMALKNSTFTGNEASNDGGGFYCSDGYLVLTNNHFENNSTSYHGGAMYLHSPRSLVMNNIDMVSNQANDGASGFFGYLCCVGSSIDITNIRVLNGSGQMPILIHQSQSYWITFKNLLIAGNSSTQAEAMQIQDGSSKIRLINSTIVNNNLTNGSTGFLKCDWGDVDLVIWNSILDANDATSILNDNTCDNYNLTIANSFVNLPSSSLYDNNCGTTNITYTSNITTGSYYEDIANGNYAPSSVSSVLGAGSATATVAGASLSAPATDLLGNTRPSPTGTSPDIGAIESIESAPQLGITAVTTDNGFCQTTSGSITANLLNYTGTATYSWSSSTYPTWTWNSTQSATGLSSGDYKVVALDATSGVKIDSIEVSVVTLPSISIVNTSTDVTCFGDDDGELTFEISGGNPLGGSQYNYYVDYLEALARATGVVLPSNGNWFDNDTYSSTRSGNYVANNYNSNPIYQGKYYVSVSDQDGCTFTDTVVVGYDHELPEVNITTLASDGTVGLTSMCEGTGNTINLTANVTGGGGTNTFSWSNASTAQAVGVAQTGDYYVEVTDQYTCVGKDTIDIYFQSAPQLVVEGAAGPLHTGSSITGVNSDFLGIYGSSSYYVIKENLTWPEAYNRAIALGGSLVNIEDQSFRNWIRDQWTDYHCCGVWVGAFFNESTQQFEWTDGSQFTLWTGTSGPNGAGSSVPYVYQTDGGGIYNRWSGESRYFLIEFSPQDAPVTFNQAFCDSIELKATPFVSAGGNGFSGIYWTDANSGDTLNIGEYATFDQGQEIILKGEFVRSDGSTCSMSSSINKFGVFGSPEIAFTTVDSISGQLFSGDNLSVCYDTELYVEANGTSDTTNSFTYLWSDGSTDSILNIESTSTTSIVVTDVLGCSTESTVSVFKKPLPVVGYQAIVMDSSSYGAPYIPNFYYQGTIGDKYIYSSNYSTTWSQARQDAIALGGDLASFSTEDEYNTLKSWAWNEKFVGLNDSVSEGVWEFSDGTPVTYYPPNWGQGEPNNAGNEDYITISYYSFNDTGENSQYEFLMQVPVPPTELPLASGEQFCDSITLFALGYDELDTAQSFSKVYWKDDLGNILDSSNTLTVRSSSNILLEGFYMQSNGSECSMFSDTIEVIINETPDLVVYSADSTFEMISDSLTLVAFSSDSVAQVSWMFDTTMFEVDTLVVFERGNYSATATNNGCSVTKDVFVERPLFVSKSLGSDITGTGSLMNPYKTIQFAIDTAGQSQTIYVLPGTYNEKLMITKGIRLLSDVVRLANPSALSSTIIKPGITGQIIRNGHQSSGGINIVKPDGEVHLEGFTIKDFQTYYDDWEKSAAIVIHESYQHPVRLENIKLTGTNQSQSQGCCPSANGIAVNYSNDVTFKKVEITGNGTANNYLPRFGWLRSSNVILDQVKFYQNYSNDAFFEIENGSSIDLINTIVSDYNQGDRNFYPIRLGSNTQLKSMNSTFNKITSNNSMAPIYLSGSNASVLIMNSVINASSGSGGQLLLNGGSSNDVTVVGSVLPSGTDLNPYGVSINTDSSTVLFDDVLMLDFKHKSSSPGIGIGVSNFNWGGISLSAPSVDIYDSIRPIPAGSFVDAGAIESSRAQGDFDINVSDCGKSLSVKVLNSDSYSVDITGPGSFQSNLQDVDITLLGLYTVSVYDSISGTTKSESININNPLRIGYTSSKNACAASGGYGEIITGDYQGGNRFNVPNDSYWAYTLSLTDTTGSSYLGTNNHVPDDDWHRDNNSLLPGWYIVTLTDASGCTVRDTLIIEDVQQSRYFVGPTGSDTTDGTFSAPLATISEALGRACDGDTIILLDGEYFENVDIQSSSPYVTISSQMILNGQSSHISMTKVNGMDEDPVFNIQYKNESGESIQFVGFTVTNGKSNSNWYGGGGITAQNSNIALQDMIISGNRSGNSGGGIGLEYCELTIENTIIENNIANSDGGGVYLTGVANIDAVGEVIVRNNKANGNGGGIGWNGNWSTSLSLTGFIIENNEAQNNGGGLSVQNGWWNNGAEILLENLVVRNNRSLYGTGGMYLNGSGNDVTLQNTVIAFNKSNSTGGLELQNADIDVVHTTIYKNNVLNATSANDQIRLNNNANVVFLNSAVGGQENIGSTTAHTFYIDDYDTTCDLTIESSIVSGGTSSIDNPYSITIMGTPIGQALYLTDPANGDYMLSPVSQGLGAGSTSYSGVNIPSVDLYGMARPGTTGENPDVGAVESPLDSAEFGAAYEIRNNIACDNTYGRLKVIPLNGTGSYKYELDDLTGTATFTDQQNVSSYTYSSLYSGDYLVTITDIGSTPNVVFTDTVSVTGKDSLSLVKDVANEFCFGEANGSISLNVEGGDGYYDYTWSTATNSNFPKSSALNNLGPEEYFVTVKDGDNCFIEDSVTIITLHSLPVVTITGQINKGGTITSTTNPQIRACAGDEVTLDAGSGFVTYNWTTVDGLNSWTTQTLPASYEQGFYVTAVDSFGCSNTDSAEVFYVQTPAIYASNVNTNIGASLQSVTSYVEGTSQRIGDNYNDAKPYGAGDKFAKMQFIIPASELIAEGLTDQTTINSIGFEVEVETGSPVQSFKVKMKNTTANQASTTFETGLTQVYSLNTLTPGEGWNTHVLDNGFVWDGTKNLLVQVEYSNVAFNSASNNILGGADMSYNAAAVATGNSSVIGNTMANFTSTWRPNFKFGIDKVQATDTLRVCDFTMLNTTDDYDTYSWLVNGTSQSSLLRYSVSSPLEVVLKTVDAASSCTMYSDTVQVLLDTTPTVFASATSLLGCIGDTLTVGLDSTASDITYTWSNGVNDSIGVFTQSGEYYVYANSISGCQGVDTVSVDINIPPDVVVELNGRVLTSTDGSLVADNSACDTTLILPYLTNVDTLSVLNSSEWSTYSDEYLVWEFQQGWDSLVDFTGPQYDADSSYTGGFYQFDPASLTDQNKVGYLQLGCVNLLGMGSPELTFDYHMVDVYADSSNTADQMGSLELQVKAAGDDNWSTVWQRSGTEPAYEWVTKSIALSAYVNKTIQLRWKGTAGVGGPRSEMALDNISINDSLALASNIAGRATPETVCEGDSLFANTVSNGTSNFSYVWSSGDTTAGIELHSTGWYSVEVVDEKNCLVTTDSVYILVNPAPSNVLVVSDTTQYCEGLFDSLMISSPSGYEHYEWFMNTGSGYLSADTTHALQVDSIANGAQQYYVVITDSLGCRSTSVAVELVQTPTPQLTVSGVDVLCNGDSTGTASVDATGSGQWVYNWSNGDTTDTVTDLPTDWYTVTVVDQYSCEATDSIFVGEPNPVSLSITAVSNVDCYGSNTGSIDIDFSGGVGGYLFSWTDSTGALSSGSEDLLNAPAGEYYLSAQDSNGCVLFDTISINEPSELIFSVDSVLDQTCKGFLDGYIGVSATGGTLPYLFNANGTSSTTGQFANLDSNFYLLTVTDSLGCIVTDSAVVSEPPAPYDEEEICVVSVDSTGSNMIVWERTPGVRTASYVILTENASTQYVPAGAQLYADFSTFVDTASNPAVRPYRYKLALIDSCGFISDTSDYHATIHLQASPGVAQNEVQLQWTPYEGKQVQTYYIYRWVDTITRVLVDSVSANVQTYTDIYPVNTTITALLYEIGAKFIVGGCSPSAGKQATYATSMSNRLDWGADGGLPIGTEEWVNVVLESDLGLFPNPTQGYLNVVMSGAWEQEENVQMKVLDITGRVIAQRQVDHGGDVRFDFRELPSGVYFLHTMTERGRIIVKRFERIN